MNRRDLALRRMAGAVGFATILIGCVAWWAESSALDAHAVLGIIGIVGTIAGTLLGTLYLRRRTSERSLRTRLDRLEALHKLIRSVTASLELDEVLEETLRQSVNLLGAKGIVIWLPASEANGADTIVSNGVDDRMATLTAHSMQGYRAGSDVIVLNRYEDAQSNTDGSEDGLQLAYTPIQLGDRTFGSIAAIFSRGECGRAQSDLLRAIAATTAEAIDNAHCYAAARAVAERDPVTGLYNHRAVHQRLESELKRASRTGSPLSVIMMDINDFKSTNDNFGHPVGDAILRIASQCLNDVCRASDITGRYGGDEFIAVLPDTSAEDTTRLIERLHQKVADTPYWLPGQYKSISFTMSTGMSVSPFDGEDASTLIATADARLYESKYSMSGAHGGEGREREGLQAGGSFLLLEQMVNAVDAKDGCTSRHAKLVASVASMMARELGLSTETLRAVRVAGLLHNVGLIGVPDHILRKDERLTPEEMEAIRRHPAMGQQIVGAMPGMEAVAECIRSHHERYDGDGYPDGMTGDQIPILARIISVADAYAAMVQPRPHRQPISKAEAIEEIRRHSGTQFDPEMVAALVHALSRDSSEVAA